MHIDQPKTRLLAKALTRPVFIELAKGTAAQDVFSFIPSELKYYRCHPIKVKALLEKIFFILRETYRSEYFYKSLVTDKIVFGRHSPRTASAQIELPVGRSFVDIAVFNGTSTAYEVKTEFDSPRRLETQTRDYLSAFENVYLVTSDSLAERYLEICDPQVGVLAVTGKLTLKTLRVASSNRNNLDQRVLFRMLRRSEYVEVLERVQGKKIDLPNGLIPAHCELLFRKLKPNEAHTFFLNAMQRRTTDHSFVEFIRSLPHYLRALAYASPLSIPQRERLIASLDSYSAA